MQLICYRYHNSVSAFAIATLNFFYYKTYHKNNVENICLWGQPCPHGNLDEQGRLLLKPLKNDNKKMSEKNCNHFSLTGSGSCALQ